MSDNDDDDDDDDDVAPMLIDDQRHVPLTILTGFLGSGKTTLLNRILEGDHGFQIAVIQNEVSSSGVEQSVASAGQGKAIDHKWLELPNGCVCCTVKDDFFQAVEQLVATNRFDHLILECSGMANPQPIISSFWVDENLDANVYLDAVVTLVDARHIESHLDANVVEAQQQIALGDIMILNKCDLVEDVAKVEQLLRGINSVSPIYRTVHCDFPISKLLDIKAFDPNRAVESVELTTTSCSHEEHNHEHGHHHHHEHSNDIYTESFEIEGYFILDHLKAYLSTLLWDRAQQQGYDILRLKGVVSNQGKKEKYSLQAVRELFSIDKIKGCSWESKMNPVNKFVFIGRLMRVHEWEDELRDCLYKTEGDLVGDKLYNEGYSYGIEDGRDQVAQQSFNLGFARGMKKLPAKRLVQSFKLLLDSRHGEMAKEWISKLENTPQGAALVEVQAQAAQAIRRLMEEHLEPT